MPSTEKIPDILDEFIKAMDEPSSNPTGLSMMVLYSQISKNGYNLVLTGDGADEVFGGYKRYSLVNKYAFLSNTNFNLFHNFSKSNNLLQGRFKKMGYPFIPSESKDFWLYWHLLATSKELNNIGWKYVNNDFNIYGEKLMNQLVQYKNKTASLMFRDLNTWLPMESNRKLDRTSMWYSIEARSPFQSENVIREGYFEMSKHKFGKVKKEVLFEAFPGLNKMPINTNKSGFISPLGYWLRNNPNLIRSSIKNVAKQLSLNEKELANLCNAPHNKDWKNFKLLWSLIVLERWLTLNES
jgi:asparagine synthase (glutamine-hydrolysing)